MGKTVRQHIEEAVEHSKQGPIYSKAEVNYSKGTDKEHCGNCDHFEVLHKNGCELVKGDIRAGMWCNKWDLYRS